MCVYFDKDVEKGEDKDTAEESKVVDGETGEGKDKFAESNVTQE